MAGFDQSPRPSDPGDHTAVPLDIAEFTEVLQDSDSLLRQLEADPRAEGSRALQQTKEAFWYISAVIENGATTPDEILRQVAGDVSKQTEAVLGELASSGTDPNTVDLGKAGKFSSLYGLGVGLKAQAFTNRLATDPTFARSLHVWNKQGRRDFVASVAFETSHIPLR